MANSKALQTILQEGCSQLTHSDSGRLDAELLLQFVLQCDRSYLYSHNDQTVNEQQHSNFQTLINQRQQGVPVAYLTGEREFWSMPLQVNRHTLIPRPETETLVEAALEYIPKQQKFSVLDLGTGSGAIALALAQERPQATITATDKFMPTLELAKKNAEHLQLTNLHFLKSDWYEQLSGKQFDMIVSNPPYIAEDDPYLDDVNLQHEPQAALVAKENGLADIQLIINNSHQYLKNDQFLALEHGWQQGNDVVQLFEQNQFKNVMRYDDLQGLHRVTMGTL